MGEEDKAAPGVPRESGNNLCRLRITDAGRLGIAGREGYRKRGVGFASLLARLSL